MTFSSCITRLWYNQVGTILCTVHLTVKLDLCYGFHIVTYCSLLGGCTVACGYVHGTQLLKGCFKDSSKVVWLIFSIVSSVSAVLSDTVVCSLYILQCTCCMFLVMFCTVYYSTVCSVSTKVYSYVVGVYLGAKCSMSGGQLKEYDGN